MKKAAILMAAALALIVLKSGKASPQSEYIDRYGEVAVSEMLRSGIPASITLAQGLLESDCGRSHLAVSANNHFGIKCHSDWTGEKFFKDDDEKNECFRVYEKSEDSFRDHSDFLSGRDRYKSLFQLDRTDYKAWAKGLRKAGYATDPKYPEKLIRIIEEYGLSKFDLVSEPSAEDSSAAPAVSADETPVREEAPGRDTLYRETHSFKADRLVLEEDGARYVIAFEGETYESLALKYRLFNSEIRRFNSAGKNDEPEAGDKVFISRHKKNRAK